MNRRYAALLAVALSAPACGLEDGPAPGDDPLVRVIWDLHSFSVGDRAQALCGPVTLVILPDRLSFDDGCNELSASYLRHGHDLQLPGWGRTDVGCDCEPDITPLLQPQIHFSTHRADDGTGRLVLTAGDARAELIAPAYAPVSRSPLAGTRWALADSDDPDFAAVTSLRIELDLHDDRTYDLTWACASGRCNVSAGLFGIGDDGLIRFDELDECYLRPDLAGDGNPDLALVGEALSSGRATLADGKLTLQAGHRFVWTSADGRPEPGPRCDEGYDE